MLQGSRGDSQYQPGGRESLTFSFSPAESYGALKVSRLIDTEKKLIFLSFFFKKNKISITFKRHHEVKSEMNWPGNGPDGYKTATTDL